MTVSPATPLPVRVGLLTLVMSSPTIPLSLAEHGAGPRPGAVATDHGGADRGAAVVEDDRVTGHAATGQGRAADVGDVVADDPALARRARGWSSTRCRCH